MSTRVPSLFSQVEQINDAVTMFANRKIFQGWEEVSVTRQLNAVASSFSLSFTDRWRSDRDSFTLKNGDSARINFGNVKVLDGFIEKLNFNLTAQQRSLSASGRSKAGDIVDCSVTGNIEFKDQTIDIIAQRLLEPFKLKLILRTDPGAPFDKIVYRQGETVFEVIDRLARERSLIMYPSFSGDLVLDRSGGTRAITELRQGVNVLTASATFDDTGRFSEYTVKGQSPSTIGSAEDSTQAMAKANDAGVSRFRPLVIVAENSVDNAAAQTRAIYEANIRAAKASTVSVSVQGWFQKDRTLWDINQIVPVDIGFIGVRQEMLISKCSYQKSNSGTITDMELVRPDAFQFSETTISKTKDPVDLLGWEKR